MRKTLTIDFVSVPWFSPRKIKLLGLFFFILGGFLAAFINHSYQLKRIHYQALLAQPQPPVMIKKPEAKPIKQSSVSSAHISMLNDTMLQLNVPWNALFNDIEKINMRDVALLQIVPNYKQQKIEISGESKNIQAVLNYIEALEATPAISHVSLQQHHVEETHPFKPTNFTIIGHWQ